MRVVLLISCVSLSGCMHGCGGDAPDDGDESASPSYSAGAEGSGPVRIEGTDEASEDYAEPPPVEPPPLEASPETESER